MTREPLNWRDHGHDQTRDQSDGHTRDQSHDHLRDQSHDQSRTPPRRTPRNIPDTVRRMFRLPPSQSQLDAELADEFQFHIDGRIEQFIATGMSRAEAEREVQARFGDYQTHWQHTRTIDEVSMRNTRRFEFFAMLWNELQHSARALRRTPSFSIIATITLALGIGATTAIYSVLDAVVLRPLPYRDAQQLVSILHPTNVPGNGERKWGVSIGGYYEFRNNARTLRDIALYRTSSFTVTNNGKADMARVGASSASLFPTLMARAEHGRLILETDDKPGAANVAVLSHEYFMRRFGGDASVVGRNLETSNGNFEIIGVAEPGLTLPMPGPFASSSNLAGFGVDVWTALQLNPAGPFYNNHAYVGVARLKPDVSLAAAQAELTRITNTFPTVLPTVYSPKFMTNYKFSTEVSDLRNAVLGPTVPRALWMVLGSVVLVLLIAAANVANLFIVRMESRRRESAIRAALGASTGHMAAHYLSESLLLAGGAAVLGLGLAAAALQLFPSVAPTNIPRLNTVSLGWSSIFISVTIALTIGLLLGALPLVRRFKISALRDGSRGSAGSTRQRMVRNTLVVGQVALALVLIAAAGLMLQSFAHLRDVKPGFNSANVSTFDISLPFTEYDTREKALTFHRELQRQILELPGVTNVGSTSDLFLEGFGTGCSVVFREGRPYATGEQTPCVSGALVGPGFFESLQVPVTGRIPSWSDIDNRTHAVVVTKSLADRLWPGEDPINKGIASNGQDSQNWYRVVGIVDGLRAENLEGKPTEVIFLAATGFRANVKDGNANDLVYTLRTSGEPTPALMQQVTHMVSRMNPRVPVLNPRSMDQVVERSMSRTSFIMVLLSLAALVALTLSGVGMYGVISYLVAQRRAEIGIRIALGAGVAGVARLIMWQSMRLAGVGVTIGLGAAFLLGKTMTTLLFGVSASDPLTMAGVSALLLFVAAAASLVPSRRASKIDPLEAMRGD